MILPGGFSYGDYLRAGAIARFSPVMQDVVALAKRGGPVIGDLQRIPDRLRGRPAARRAAAQREPQVRLRVRRAARRDDRHAVHEPLRAGRHAARSDRAR